MSRPLRALMVEDSEADADLLLVELRRHGYDPIFERVETAKAMRRALEGKSWDVVLSDFRLPRFTGVAALALVQELGLDMPFILVSGTIGEETAVAALKAGAHDFVTKENLSRLCPAIEREMREAANRRDLRRAEQSLRRSEAHFRALIEHSMDSIAILDGRGRITYESPSIKPLLGYSPAELEGSVGFDYVHPDDQSRVRALLAAAAAAGTPVIRAEFRFRHKDGSWRTFEGVVTNLLDNPAVAGFVVNSRDITDRKQAELDLALNNVILATQQETTLEGILVVDEHGRILSFNQRFVELWGIPADLVAAKVDQPVLEFATRQVADPAAFLSRVAYLYEHRQEKSQEEIALKDGRTFDRYSAPMFGADGGYYGRVWYFRDITERKRAEAALRRSEADFRSLVEHAPLGIYRASSDGPLLTVNPALIKMLGYRWAEELLRLDIARDVYAEPEERAELLAALAQRDDAEVETVWKRRDGSRITVRISARAVRRPDGGMEYVEGLVENVTEQRSLEVQFRQAQRLEAVGRLAGGVAHDFNNVLTAITGYSDLMLEDLPPDDPKRADVEEIKAAALRAAALTRQLLAFSRKQVFQTRVLDLNDVVQTLDKMLRRLIGEDVKLELALASGLGAVRADPGQIEQVILNLAVNSRDAMASGGRLTMETANVELDEAYGREHAGAVPGRYVMLAVSDTGHGMDAETRSHIFEPFFTTKELGKGTGLGLSTVYGIVKQSGGYVWVYSEPGHGTTFKVYLPQVDEQPEKVSVAVAPEPVAGGRETVLLAEDDPSVRAVVAEVLTQKGYRVLRAPDGQAALEVARGHPAEISLLVTDIVMPGMTGRELAEALKAERPGLRVLYMSGYTDDAVVRHGVLEEGMPYLQKPFAPRALASKVREVLDRS